MKTKDSVVLTRLPRRMVALTALAVWFEAASQSPAQSWLVGNSGTTAGTHFLGTTDGQPLEIKVNGLRAFRLEPTTRDTPNVIAGSPGNTVASGVIGATIAGGGNGTAAEEYAEKNFIGAHQGTIGGGQANVIGSGAFTSTIAGGEANSIGASLGTIAGGIGNEIHQDAVEATISGGSANTINDGAAVSVIGGGSANFIGAESLGATISGGAENRIGTMGRNGSYATIPGGYQNEASGQYSFAAGQRAKAYHDGTFVWADAQEDDFASTAANQFLIRAAGGVGIGTTTPSTALEAVKAFKYGRGQLIIRHSPTQDTYGWLGAGTDYFVIGAGHVAPRTGIAFAVGTGAATERMRITPEGRVGIATADPAFALHVNGDAGKPGGGSWSVASDRRLKNVGRPFTRGLKALEKLEPKHYRYAEENPLCLPSDREYVGLVAQDVRESIPEAVEENETGFLHLNNDPILWTMLNAVHELNHKLEEELQRRDGENADLKERLARLEQLLAARHEEVLHGELSSRCDSNSGQTLIHLYEAFITSHHP